MPSVISVAAYIAHSTSSALFLFQYRRRHAVLSPASRKMSALTTQMMLSSMLGYIALGAAIAAFLPAVITNAVNRRSQTGPGFLAVWFLADIVRRPVSFWSRLDLLAI